MKRTSGTKVVQSGRDGYYPFQWSLITSLVAPQIKGNIKKRIFFPNTEVPEQQKLEESWAEEEPQNRI